uniref:NADH-ubiquinone oxidoreductase chain 2 n=1 Tax=Scriptaphyosemion cauveti TaxID=1289024 RepID=A0A518LY83_9TELE|nr:NADH dehydrogenase subunit 2 [Scriptaphyosemion cauveti]QDW10567.1 NADH dehydrogenase subunit 2 [Scriptaphyosemion cauveti]
MSPHILMIFLFCLGLGTMVTFSSSNWLLAWMGLEINTLAIIPLMAQHHHPRAVEATTKYFLIQAAAAATLLFAGMINAWTTGQWDISSMMHPIPSTIMIMALTLKLGLAPAHAWLPDILQGLDLNIGLILATWQKLAPFSILLQMQHSSSLLLILLGLLSTFVGGWGGLNQTQLRKILAYSSIAHLGWMLLVLQFSPNLTLFTLMLYFIMTFSIFSMFSLNNSMNINSLTTSWTKAPIFSALAPMILLSLGGLPPLSGFLPKWMIIQELSHQGMALIATIAALSALLSLYFYLRLSYAMALTFSPNSITGTPNWRLSNTNMNMPLAISSSATILLLPLAPAMSSIIMP